MISQYDPTLDLKIKWIVMTYISCPSDFGGWSGGAMVLGKLPVPGRPTILITVGQGPIALAVGAGGGCLDIFTLIYPFLSLPLSLGDGGGRVVRRCWVSFQCRGILLIWILVG